MKRTIALVALLAIAGPVQAGFVKETRELVREGNKWYVKPYENAFDSTDLLHNECRPLALYIQVLWDKTEGHFSHQYKGLTIEELAERVETVVESQLRVAGIFDGFGSAYIWAQSAWISGHDVLEVWVGAEGNTFNVQLSTKFSANRYLPFSEHYSLGTVGAYRGDTRFLIQAVSEYTGYFINEYLRLNTEYCD